MFGKKKDKELNLGDIDGSSDSQQPTISAKETSKKPKKQKKQKEPKERKEKEKKQKKPKQPKQPGSGRQALAYAMIIVGGLLCIRSISALAGAQNPLTQAQAEQAAALSTGISDLENQSANMPDIDSSIVESIKSQTSISDALQENLRSDAESCGLSIASISGFEKKNSFGVLKAGYQLEGSGDVSGITRFLQTLNDRNEAMLVNEVFLSEGPTITMPDGSVMKGGSQDYRIILEHSYTKGGQSEPVKQEQTVPETSEEEQQDPPQENSGHEHVFDNEGWTVAPTHETGGTKVKICSICNEVVTEDQPLDESAHTWGAGECGKRTCEVCGEQETVPHHYMSNWTETPEPTCYLIGYRTRRCLNEDCNAEETEEIPKTEHSWIVQDGREICGVCGEAKDVGLQVTTS